MTRCAAACESPTPSNQYAGAKQHGDLEPQTGSEHGITRSVCQRRMPACTDSGGERTANHDADDKNCTPSKRRPDACHPLVEFDITAQRPKWFVRDPQEQHNQETDQRTSDEPWCASRENGGHEWQI